MRTVGLCAGAVFLLLLPGAASVKVGLILMCCAAGSFAITCSGFAPNGLDIAPRHADVIWGIGKFRRTLLCDRRSRIFRGSRLPSVGIG